MNTKIEGGIQPPFPIVSMCEHQGRIFVATQHRIYELIDGVFRPIIFADGVMPGASK